MKIFFANKLNVFLVSFLLLLSAGLVVVAVKAFGPTVVEQKGITVIDFSGKTEADVNAWCQSLEKNPCVILTKNSDEVEKGKVIYQTIIGDELLHEDESITFYISLGKTVNINIPTIDKNTTKEIIENWAKENSLTNVNYLYEINETVDKGYVIKIEPSTINSASDEIKVYVSKGKSEKTETIEIIAGTYANLTVEKFEEKVKTLGLVPTHDSETDAFSSTVAKGDIVWHGSGNYINGEKIRYGLSKGKNENLISVSKGTYIGVTVDEFKTAVAKLGKKGLKPVHNEDYDDYSSTISKGNIVWHGSGDYEDEENITYGLSKGIKEGNIIVSYGSLTNKTVESFTSIVKNFGSKGLVPNHNTSKDEYSDTIKKGYIVWHGSGTYEDGETINYGLSLGSKEAESNEIVVKEGTYIGNSLDDFKKAVEALGLVPYHRSEWDVKGSSDKLNTIARNGYGTYVKGENISYGLYISSDSSEIIINKGDYVGKTLDEFKNIVKGLGLVPEHSEVYDDEYSTTIAAGSIDWHGSGTYVKGEVIHYTVSLGKLESVTVAPGYVGKSVTEFENYIKSLGLTPKNTGTDYSDSIAAGLILSYTSGDYAKNSTVNYVTSSGTNPNVTVSAGLEGKTAAQFIAAIPSSLSVEHDPSKDEYSSYAENTVCSYRSGQYTKGSTVYYGLSLGKAPVYLERPEAYNNIYGVQCNTFDLMKTQMQSILSSFSNLSFESVTSRDKNPGQIDEITINGSSTYEKGNKPADSVIVVYIVSARQSS